MKEMADEEFFRKYATYEKESAEDFIKRHDSTERELRDTIAYLIRHREMMRDVELKKLETEAEKLIEKLKDTKRKELLEEIECFKEILALHKRLIRKDDTRD